MLVAFYDESGNDGQSRVFAMAGVLMCGVTQYHFANDWAALLKQYALREFHATDFHHRRKEFLGWSDDQALRFRDAIIDLLLRWDVKHTGVAIPVADYQRSFVETGFNKSLVPAISKWKKPYLPAFQHVISDLRSYAVHQPAAHLIHPVFDQCQEFMGQAKADYSTRNKDGRLGTMFVSNTREYVQLQAADFLVWEYRVGVETFAGQRRSRT